MFVYAFAKARAAAICRSNSSPNAESGYKGILSHFVKPEGGDVSLTDTVKASGLGGEPYRDGSYAYYIGEKVATNDPKGIGAFLLASTEMENAQNPTLGRGSIRRRRRLVQFSAAHRCLRPPVEFHYKWDTMDKPGYSLFGHLFRLRRATSELDAEPTVGNLRGAQVFIIASPDNLDKNPLAHFATCAMPRRSPNG